MHGMSAPVSRRAALARLGVAGAGLVLAPAILRGQSSPIVVAGRPVEIVIAMHVRAGAILPIGPIKHDVDESVDVPLNLIIYPGADGAFALYEDDGKTFNYRRGEWMRLAMTWADATRRFTMRLTPGSPMRPPVQRPIDLRVAGEKKSRRLVLGGKPIDMSL